MSTPVRAAVSAMARSHSSTRSARPSRRSGAGAERRLEHVGDAAIAAREDALDVRRLVLVHLER